MDRNGLILFPFYSMVDGRTSNILDENASDNFVSLSDSHCVSTSAPDHNPLQCPRCQTPVQESSNWCVNCGELLLGLPWCKSDPNDCYWVNSATNTLIAYPQRSTGGLPVANGQDSRYHNTADCQPYSVATASFLDPGLMSTITNKSTLSNQEHIVAMAAQQRSKALHVAETSISSCPQGESLESNVGACQLNNQSAVSVGSLRYASIASPENTELFTPNFEIGAPRIASSYPDYFTPTELQDIQPGSAGLAFEELQLSHAMQQLNFGRQRCISGPAPGSQVPINFNYYQGMRQLNYSPIMYHSSETSSSYVSSYVPNMQASTTCSLGSACTSLLNPVEVDNNNVCPSSFLDDFISSNENQISTSSAHIQPYPISSSLQHPQLSFEYCKYGAGYLDDSAHGWKHSNAGTNCVASVCNNQPIHIRSFSSEQNLVPQPVNKSHLPSSSRGKRYWQSSRNLWSANNPCLLKKKPTTYIQSSNSRKPTKSGPPRNSTRRMCNQPGTGVDNPSGMRSATAASSHAALPSSGDNEISTAQEATLHKPDCRRSDLEKQQLQQSKPHSQSSDKSAVASGTDDHPDWLHLPDEIWLSVFRLLPLPDRAHAASVCRRLAHLVLDTSLWRVVQLHRRQNLTDTILASIGRLQPRELKFSYCRGDAITVDGLRTLFQSCGTRLRKLSLIGCTRGPFDQDSPLQLAAEWCPQLNYVNASYMQTVCDQTVINLAKSVKWLISVKLNGAQHISNEAIQQLVHHQQDSLERLELFGCFSLTSDIFLMLSKCQQLRALAFGHLHRLSSDGLLDLVGKLPRLASLDLRGTQTLTSDASLSRLASQCPQLEEVVLANMQSLQGEDGLVQLLRRLSRLRILDLCGLKAVGDQTMEALAAGCPLLEQLDVSCTSVTQRGLRFLARHPAKNLRCLRISYCRQVQKNVLEKVVRACPRLLFLHAYGFGSMKDWSFLFKLRPGLSVINEA